MDLFPDNINKDRAYTSPEDLKIQKRKYREQHLEKLIARDKERYQENREERLEDGKKYYEAHREERNAYSNKYRNDHKEEINEKRRIKKPCPHCDKLMNRSNLTRHIKTMHK